MEWIFNGIGTQILSLIVGIVIGIIGEKTHQKYICKVKQKSGDNSIQVNTSVKGYNSGNTHVIRGDMNVYSVNDEFDIRQISFMSNSEIEKVIYAGNDVTVRKWCLELILRDEKEYLINKCIAKMTNDQEKFKLLKELIERGFVSTKYCRLIEESITNNVNLFKIIEIYISLGFEDHVSLIFGKINNNNYLFKSLTLVYPVNSILFDSLYQNGSCFNDDKYIKKMEEWICEYLDTV